MLLRYLQIVLCCCVLVPGLTVAQAHPHTEASPPDSAAETPLDANPTDGDAQGFAVTSIADEPIPFCSRDLYGAKPVLLIFWATWSESCVKQIPVLNELYAEYGDRIQFLGLSIDTATGRQTAEEQVREAQAEHQMAYPTALDESRTLADRFGVRGIPLLVMVDLEGDARTLLGYREASALRQHLEQLASASLEAP